MKIINQLAIDTNILGQLLDLLHESANSPHPPTPSPKEGEGEPDIGSYGDFVVGCQVPLPTWERDLG